MDRRWSAHDTGSGEAGRGAPRRRRLWEIKEGIQCSIVGTCLTRADTAALLRKAGVQLDARAKEYQRHSFLVAQASQAGLLGRLIDKALDRKYATQVARVGRTRDAAALRGYWEEACAKGDVAGAYWALLSHGHLPDELRLDAFGDVHMLSHYMGGVNRGDGQARWRAERQAAQLAERLERARRGARETLAGKDARIAELEDEVGQLRAVPARPQVAPPSPRSRGAARAQRRLGGLERRLAATRARLRAAEVETGRLRHHLELLEQLPVCPSRAPPAPPADSPKPACPLAAARLLYVGGRPSALPHLRHGAARHRAELLHHDGGIEQSLAQLQDLVARADMVFCPIDCVSHGACLLARDLCRRLVKPFVPLRSASLSQFRRALSRCRHDLAG